MSAYRIMQHLPTGLMHRHVCDPIMETVDLIGGFTRTVGQLGTDMDTGSTEAAAMSTGGMLAGMMLVAGGRTDGWIGGCTIDDIEEIGGGCCIIADDWMGGYEGGGIEKCGMAGVCIRDGIVRTAGAAKDAVMVGKRLASRLPDLGVS